MKAPAFQFYPADWRKDPGIQSLSLADRGAWFEMLCLMHESPHRGILLLPSGEPMTPKQLARILGISESKMKQILNRISTSGVSGTDQLSGAILCRRMVADEKLRATRSQCGQQGAAFGHLGGRPKFAPGKITPSDHNSERQNNPPSSSSSSSDTPIVPKTPKPVQAYSADFERFWEAYPRKCGKGAAFIAWKKNGRPHVDRIIEVLAKAKRCEQWTKDSGQFIPHPATWLNQKRWDDDYSTTAKSKQEKQNWY